MAGQELHDGFLVSLVAHDRQVITAGDDEELGAGNQIDEPARVTDEGVVATDDDLQKGLGVSEALLRAQPDLNGIACVSATGGPTLAQVIQGPEFEGRDIKIVAFDDLEETVRAIEDGIILATMVQRPVQMGVLSIRESYEILTQGKVPDCALLDTGVTVVTLENLDSYTK